MGCCSVPVHRSSLVGQKEEEEEKACDERERGGEQERRDKKKTKTHVGGGIAGGISRRLPRGISGRLRAAAGKRE